MLCRSRSALPMFHTGTNRNIIPHDPANGPVIESDRPGCYLHGLPHHRTCVLRIRRFTQMLSLGSARRGFRSLILEVLIGDGPCHRRTAGRRSSVTERVPASGPVRLNVQPPAKTARDPVPSCQKLIRTMRRIVGSLRTVDDCVHGKPYVEFVFDQSIATGFAATSTRSTFSAAAFV
jgi:hypothetical protein